MKTCSECKDSKPIDTFPRVGKNYLSNRCKVCTSLYKKQWKLNHIGTCKICGNNCSYKSSRCRSCAVKSREFVKEPIYGTCESCNKSFSDTTHNYSKMFCSKNCCDKYWYHKNRDSLKDRYSSTRLEWHSKNREHRKEYHAKRQTSNPEIARAKSAKRRATKLNAIIGNYDKEIKELYANCPKGFHVDHIVPLKNNMVCGLHVPWNLQYLPAVENLKKSNKLG